MNKLPNQVIGPTGFSFARTNFGEKFASRGGKHNIRRIPHLIDLFSLYVLFSHFRPCDATRGNSFFQMSSYARANVHIINEKTRGKFP